MAQLLTYRVVIPLGETGTDVMKVRGHAVVMDGVLAILEGDMGTPLLAAFSPGNWLSVHEVPEEQRG